MSTQVFDNNGNLVVGSGDAIGAASQQVADTSGTLINPSREDGNLLSIKTNTDKLDVLSSTRASETTLSGIKTQTDQLSFTSSSLNTNITNATLAVTQSGTWSTGRTWVLSSGTDSALAVQSGNWSVRLQDGAGTALTSSLVNTRQALDIHQADTSFIISGLTAVGNAPSLNPVSISGVDGSGLKRHLLTDSTGRIVPVAQAVVSTANSTTTPLGSNAIFTGTYEEVKDYSTVSIVVMSDQASAAQGFQIDWSNNGSTVIDTDNFTFNPSNAANRQYTFGPIARYMRIRYTNGSVAQGSFVLQTMLRPFALKPSSHRVGNVISNEADAELVKAVLSAEDNNGTFNNVKAISLLGDTRLEVVSADIALQLAIQDRLYTVSFDQNLAVAATDNRVMFFRNPVGSGKRVYLSKIILDVLTKGAQAGWKLFKTPTITATGTAQTPQSTRIGASLPTPVTLVYSAPTASATGTRIRAFSTGKDANTFVYDFQFEMFLDPGYDLLLTGDPDANNKVAAVTVVWAEV